MPKGSAHTSLGLTPSSQTGGGEFIKEGLALEGGRNDLLSPVTHHPMENGHSYFEIMQRTAIVRRLH